MRALFSTFTPPASQYSPGAAPRRWLLALLGLMLLGWSASAWPVQAGRAAPAQPNQEGYRVQVPKMMDYCGLLLKFTPEARALVQEEVDRLMQNLMYHRVMVERADMYMPYIKTAFRDMGVPEDLVYIAIQESALKGDAVSKSNAVGFWQFKDFTAREVGLLVNSQVDERKHVYRASVGAALYFNKNYLRHHNWVYAVISYMEGGTGALPYIKDQYKGAREMVVDADLHWYARRAIAHKLAYQPFIGENPPKTWLAVASNKGETNVRRLVNEHQVRLEDFRKYNLWARSNTLPADRPFSFYYPTQPAKRPQQYAHDPHRDLFQRPLNAYHQPSAQLAANYQPKSQAGPRNTTTRVDQPLRSEKFRSKPEQTHTPSQPSRYPVNKDPEYGETFVVVKPGEALEAIALDYDVKAKRLRRWNNLPKPLQPEPGDFLTLVKPRKAQVHIAQENQTLADVALLYRKKPDKLMRLNRLPDYSSLLTPGRKIYLDKPRPRQEDRIVYRLPGEQQPFQIPEGAAHTTPSGNASRNSGRPLLQVSTQLGGGGSGSYTVKPGETLWRIARIHGVTVQALKEANNLSADTLEVDQVLTIPHTSR